MWMFLALLTAVFTSLSDVSGRKALERVDVYTVAWAWPFFCSVFLVPFVLIRGVPPLGLAFVPALVTSTLILTVSAVFYAKAIHASDLSLTMPMLTVTPVFLLVTSPLMLGEYPRPAGLLGIVLIVAGSYILNVKDYRHGFMAPFTSLFRQKGPQYMLAVALFYSVGANVDKIGVQNSSPLFWTVAVNGLVAVFLSPFVFKRTLAFGKTLKQNGGIFFLMGSMSGLANLSQMLAIDMTIVPYLIAVKRTSVFMTSLLGFWIFKEHGWRERSIGILLMVAGVFVIAIFQ